MATGPVLSYTPPPNELPYYDGLFYIADKERTGQLNGREAVAFLARSKLPVDLLKNIWTMADQNPKTNSLDRSKFDVAVRLIQLFQNGQKAQGTNLSAALGVTMRPPYFEGVSDVVVKPPSSITSPNQSSVGYESPNSYQQPPMQPIPQMQLSPPRPIYSQQHPPLKQLQQQAPLMQQHQQAPLIQQQHAPPKQQEQPSMALAKHDPYAMLPGEQGRYEMLFPQYETHKDGYVYGKEAVDLFSKSGLSKETLRDIWNMVDDPVDNRLDPVEFATAMHLIVCVSKKGLPVPSGLPPSLQGLKVGQQGEGRISRNDLVDSSINKQRKLQQHQSPVSIPSPIHAPHQAPSLSMGGLETEMLNRSVMTPRGINQSYGSTPLQQNQFGFGMGNGPPPIKRDQFGISLYTQHISSGESVGEDTTTAGGDMASAGGPNVNAIGGVSISDAFNELNLDTATAGAHNVSAPVDGVISFKDGPSQQDNVGFSSFPKATPFGEISFDKRKEDDLKMRMSTLTFRPPSPGTSGLPPKTFSPPSRTSSSGKVMNKVSNSVDCDNANLTKLRTVLQKLQAESISLKAQLGQLLDDELNVRRQITETVSDIGTLSQEMTGLHDQFATAKASLVEATEELKIQLENKDMVKDLISDSQGTLGALNSSTANTKDAVKSATAKRQSYSAPSAAFESNVFDFGPSDSSSSLIKSSKNDLSLNEDSQDKFNHTLPSGQFAASGISIGDRFGGASVTKQSLQRDTSTQSVEPMGGSPLAVQTKSDLNAQSFGHSITSFASSQTAKEIQTLKLEAEKAEKEAEDAERHARALFLQLDDFKTAAGAAEALAQEKQAAVQSVKKGFGRSSMKKLTKKEADVAMQEALDKRRIAQDAQKEAADAQAEAIRKKRQADLLRHETEEAETQVTKSESASEARVGNEFLDTNTSKFDSPMEYGNDNTSFEAPYGSSFAPMGYPGSLEGGGNSNFSNSPNRMPAFGSVDQTPPSPGLSSMGGYSFGQRNQTAGASGMGNGEKTAGFGTGMDGGMGIGYGMGMSGGKNTGDSGGGIPSPGNSVSGDDYINPFSGY